MPCSRAVAHRARTSSIVPSSGWTASWPPSAPPIAYGEPGSSGPATSVLLRPLRFVDADRVDRRQVEHVEAELGDRRARCASTPFRPPQERGKSSYQEPKRARDAVDLERQRLLELRSRRGARRRAPSRRTAPAPSAASSFALHRRVGVASTPSACSIERLSASPLARSAARSSSTTPSDSSPARSSCAGGDLALQLVAPGGEEVGPGLDRELPAAHASSTGELALPAHAVDVRVDRRAARPRASGGRPGPR